MVSQNLLPVKVTQKLPKKNPLSVNPGGQTGEFLRDTLALISAGWLLSLIKFEARNAFWLFPRSLQVLEINFS